MSAFERRVESALGHELDIFIDGEDQVLSRVRLTLLTVQHVPASVERRQHAGGNTVRVAVELTLHTSQATVVSAHVSQDLRGKLAVGIEALEFLLEVHPFE